jgi:hypothetical protein
MKLFQCQNCAHPLFFENDTCEKCRYQLAYRDSTFDLIALGPDSVDWTIPNEGSHEFTYCKNHEFNACNWLVLKTDTTGFCTACKLNRTIPDLSIKKNLKKWKRIEVAKHRLVYQLQKLSLPVQSKLSHPETGLCFDFLSRKGAGENAKIMMTGHANGVVTILLSEADSVLREQMKRDMNERYRTLIGHFRHEVGHYYWERLIFSDDKILNDFRKVFGDERPSYGQALKDYYKNGPVKKWRKNFISKYASSHPWEDWAETWAHYLHILDTLETAYYFGIKVKPHLTNKKHMEMKSAFDPYDEPSFKKIVSKAIPLFFSINSINRSMGIADVYPFVISKPVIKKMEFIHALVRRDIA